MCILNIFTYLVEGYDYQIPAPQIEKLNYFREDEGKITLSHEIDGFILKLNS